LNVDSPWNLKNLVSEGSLLAIMRFFKEKFNVIELEIVSIVAHKLVNSQHIGVHNDYIDEVKTHRLTHRMVLHINPTWKEENGGYLMLFNSESERDISEIVYPINNSVFGFEISKKSHHAISRIYDFARFTIVYTFKEI
jgi:Rps23 Pro-64 3,4-dihydroxylase Tpa1-like proline 4-hydroxylase